MVTRVPNGCLRLRHLVALLIVTFLSGMVLGIVLITSTDTSSQSRPGRDHVDERRKDPLQSRPPHPLREQVESLGHIVHQNMMASKKQGTTKAADYAHLPQEGDVKEEESDVKEVEPNYNIHVFYYPWYGTPEHDGKYYHWNHEYLQHWDAKEAARWPKGHHTPPGDIGASFYPALGPYSSSDPAVIDDHMLQMRSAGIGTLSLSWYPPSMADDAGKPGMSDALVSVILDLANKHQLKVCLHIEPYKGRDHATLRENLKYIHENYGSHPAYYKHRHGDKLLPLFYIYDSYLVRSSDWASLFKEDGRLTVRNTELDGIFIGLVVEAKHKVQVLEAAGFDGFYTYFASEGFTYGSRVTNWKSLQDYAESKNALFIPSVGPGYNDERVRPWNARNTKSRENGEYYQRMFRAAVNINPPVISITSFNEWHEGTQIEKSIPKSIPSYNYLDFRPNPEDYYLALTKTWAFKYRQHNKASGVKNK